MDGYLRVIANSCTLSGESSWIFSDVVFNLIFYWWVRCDAWAKINEGFNIFNTVIIDSCCLWNICSLRNNFCFLQTNGQAYCVHENFSIHPTAFEGLWTMSTATSAKSKSCMMICSTFRFAFRGAGLNRGSSDLVCWLTSTINEQNSGFNTIQKKIPKWVKARALFCQPILIINGSQKHYQHIGHVPSCWCENTSC